MASSVTSSISNAAALGASSFVTFPIDLVRSFGGGQLTAHGATAVEQVDTLPKNARVGKYEVTVRAGGAEWTLAGDVGQLHQQQVAADDQTTTIVVVDFGVLRTVAGVGVKDTSQFQVSQVRSWAGTAFADKAVLPQATRFPSAAFQFASQIRTERLEITLVGSAVGDDILSQWLLVQLPDLPTDFDLRINGGPPVWTAPGIALAQARGWLAPAEGDPSGLPYQVVDLAAAVNALLADPSAAIAPPLDLHFVLSARVPGALQLELPALSATGARYLAEVPLPPGQEELRFTAEGVQAVPLTVPSWVDTVEAIALTVTAKLPPERTVPPVGPDVRLEAVPGGSPVPLAEMRLDPERAAAVSLGSVAPGAGLGELLGVRLPLAGEAGGAEVRALLLAGDPGGPGQPLDGGASKPAEIAAVPAGGEAPWSTFTFPRPWKLAAPLPYVAIVVTRGNVRWALSGDAAAAVRFGPPDGPWQPLPDLGELSSLGGRVRMTGHAAAGHAIAPLQLALARQGSPPAPGADAPTAVVTPTAKGVAVDVAAPDGLTREVELRVVSLVAGTVNLKDLVITATQISGVKPPPAAATATFAS